MKTIVLVIATLIFIPSCLGGDAPSQSGQLFWPQWRGPEANGVAPDSNPPLDWSEDKNIKWKVAVPGSGHATPIVWEDRIFLLTAIGPAEERESREETEEPEGRRRRGRGEPTPTTPYQFTVLALDRNSGAEVWRRAACEEPPHEGIHRVGSWASASPVTDGECVIAFFGSRGLYCFDMEGKLLWEKDFGDMTIKRGFGEGSSPALHGDTIVVTWDHEGPSFIVALDKKTGEEKWRVDRDESTAWATPLVVEHGGKAQVVTNATNRVRSYDLESGQLLWECGGMTGNVIPTPVSRDGLVYVTSGFRGSALFAIDLGQARGDIEDSQAMAWAHDKDTPYIPSPLLYDEQLYILKGNDGILSCFNAKTGSDHFSRQRLEGVRQAYASPVGAADRVYVVGREGTTVVLNRGPEYEVLATNTLDDEFSASPAMVDDEIYLRGHHSLYCISAN